VNRNFDFLFDFRTAFASTAILEVSDLPGDPNYQGPFPFSEPESRNIRYLLDTYPHIRLLIDLHCSGQMLMYPWHHDNNQGVDPSKSFRNSVWDGKRGVRNDGYGEYVHSVDEGRWRAVCWSMQWCLGKVYDRASYSVRQAYEANWAHVKTGTTDGYAFSRHLVDPAKGKVDALVIEWGTSQQPEAGPHEGDVRESEECRDALGRDPKRQHRGRT
jgi:hypothetical protein